MEVCLLLRTPSKALLLYRGAAAEAITAKLAHIVRANFILAQLRRRQSARAAKAGTRHVNMCLGSSESQLLNNNKTYVNAGELQLDFSLRQSAW